MNIERYKASERGYANYDWLQANYSFSFANYYNPGRTNFGALRVLNDDIIQGGKGFGMHSHENMEIITIPLQGTLAHKDSMSDKWISLQTGDVQVMTAGKGIMHAEKNNSPTDFINLFQIWIMPGKINLEPSYHQMNFKEKDRKNNIQTLVTSYSDTKTKSLKIYQDVRISRIDLDENMDFSYKLLSEDHGVYVMLISGEITIQGKNMERRDAAGVYQTDEFLLKTIQPSEILFIEVPMKF